MIEKLKMHKQEASRSTRNIVYQSRVKDRIESRANLESNLSIVVLSEFKSPTTKIMIDMDSIVITL